MASFFDVTSWPIPAQLGLLAALVVMSALFSASETALIGLSTYRRKHLAHRGSEAADAADRIMARPERVIIAILIGNNIVNTAAAAIATSIAIGAFGNAGLGIATGAMTFILLTFGEIVPKTMAAGNTQGVALAVARPMSVFMKVAFPIIWLYGEMTDAMYRVFGVPTRRRTLEDEEEFKTIVNIGAREGVIEPEEHDIIHRVIDFSDTAAREAMVPRTDMVCLATTATVADAIRAFTENGYSRLPVYEGSRDHVVGILYAKDTLAAHVKGAVDDPVTAFMKEPYYVPESSRLDGLFRQMRDRRVHMAILLDEYGGTEGLITMEDILEEIVGEIFDEYDTEAGPILWDDGRTSASIDARMPVGDLNRVLGLDIPVGAGYDSLGGFVFHELGRPAQVGDIVRYGNAEFQVERAGRRRIFAVQYKRIVPVDEAEARIE